MVIPPESQWVLWEQWWAWGIVAVALVAAEIIVPGYVLLGFGIGAALVALLALALPADQWMLESLPRVLLVFALLSLACWLALRRWAGIRREQVRIIDRDVNDA